MGNKSTLTDAEGWTPLFDKITRHLGLTASAVFGRVWRYCQGEQQACTASLETISRDISLDRATVMRQLRLLVDEGYLVDRTPGVKYRPHVYADTGLASQKSVAPCNTLAERDSKSVAPCNTSVAQSNTTVAQCNKSVAQSHLKIQIREEEENIKENIVSSEKEPTNGTENAMDGELRLKNLLKGDVKTAFWEQYISPTRVISASPGIWVFSCPDEKSKAYLDQRAKKLISNHLLGITGETTTVRFEVHA